MAEHTSHFEDKVVMVTGFRVGRMPQEHGPQLVWVEMDTAHGKTVPFVCSVLQALEWAELLEEEATRPMAQGRA
jgi:hypothetical protein